MLPTRDQIERAAYDRWIRRAPAHGHDRDDWIGSENELTYLLNYQTVVEYPLDSSTSLILGNTRLAGAASASGRAPTRFLLRFATRRARPSRDVALFVRGV